MENLYVKHEMGFWEALAEPLLPESMRSCGGAGVGLFALITADYCVANVIGFLTAGSVRKLLWLVVAFKQSWLRPVRRRRGMWAATSLTEISAHYFPFGERCTTLPAVAFDRWFGAVPVGFNSLPEESDAAGL